MENLMDKIVSLAKRRGFIFPSSEIYGGFSSCYDYGPIGVELKNNIKQQWWKTMVHDREDIVGLDASILMSPKVWYASGHLSAGFADPMAECKKCNKRFRADHLKEQAITKCPECGGELGEVRKFNLMMKTFVGPLENDSSITYLRAETCQGIYVNFKNVLDTMRPKIPFGIAQIGKAFRNEITPGNFTYRMREFEQMEQQFFIRPGENEKYFEEWKKLRMQWYVDLGINPEKLKFHEHAKEDLAHYAKAAFDIEYDFPFDNKELEGIHDRGDWDLSNHAKSSKQDLSYFDTKLNTKFVPNIIETSAGADRACLAFLVDAYHEESVKDQVRVVLKFHPKIAPIKIAVLPLAKNKTEITDLARKIFNDLKTKFVSMYDDSGSIGKLYRRQDEIGTPYCVTIDFDSLEDKKVTVRDRDSMEQERVEIEGLKDYFEKKIGY
ncbi:MAG: glycine--tRNA ligase [Patescibacteria group bacterium]|jgi:glycyl-tRNA synthetase